MAICYLSLSSLMYSTDWNIMYPWSDALPSWADSSQLYIGVLGLVAILSVEGINSSSVGRIVPSRYAKYFILLSAFIITCNCFINKRQYEFIVMGLC